MIFTQIPPQYAPAGGELHYTLSELNGNEVRVYIRDSISGSTLGVKRFAGRNEVTFDVAPYVRQVLLFTPTSGRTGFYPATGRIASIEVEAVTGFKPGVLAGVRNFLATTHSVTASALLTSMPLERMIAPGECDELSFLSTGSCTVTVSAELEDTFVAERYRDEGEGLHLFRLDLHDFPEVEVLAVDAGECGTLVYTVDRTPQRGRRLAWRTDAGSIEHYTFPLEKAQIVKVAKKWAQGFSGYIPATVETEVHTVLQSAFEFRDTLQALAGILSAPQVWSVVGDSYTPIDITSEAAVTHSHDMVGRMDIEYRPIHKFRSPWS